MVHTEIVKIEEKIGKINKNTYRAWLIKLILVIYYYSLTIIIQFKIMTGWKSYRYFLYLQTFKYN
jgi:hypothetical protein